MWNACAVSGLIVEWGWDYWDWIVRVAPITGVTLAKNLGTGQNMVSQEKSENGISKVLF